MTTTLPAVASAYIRATNNHDSAAFIAAFAEGAVVDDAGREFRGLDAIKAWSDREIIEAQVTLEVLDVADHDGQTIISTKVDGNFDRTGLPDPLILNHHLTVEHDQIVELKIQLAG